jgi:hypothetical protein
MVDVPSAAPARRARDAVRRVGWRAESGVLGPTTYLNGISHDLRSGYYPGRLIRLPFPGAINKR